MATGRRFWGWGREEDALSVAEQRALAARVAPLVGDFDLRPVPAPTRNEIELPSPRLTPPPSMAGWFSTDPEDRAGHTYGKSFRDLVRALERNWRRPPDCVVRPPDESGVEAVLEWASEVGAMVIPYGGGSSVVGGVEVPAEDDRPVMSCDLVHLSRVLEIDHLSRAARIEAGTLGPALEDQLRPYGLTLRHFPQSFEFSSLGGWLATRSAGHFATLATHIDDAVESIRAVTPAGITATRRLPGSGAGPSPDRLLLGSEGILGIITEAWVRLQARPRWRASAVGHFSTFESAVTAVRKLGQSGLWPANCRLLDATEALISGSGDGSAHLVLLGFESADHPVDEALTRAAEIVGESGGTIPSPREEAPSTAGAGGAGGADPERSGIEEHPDASTRWRASFLRAPYFRDELVRMGLVSETFETAITWDRFDTFVDGIRTACEDALRSAGAWPAVISCRLTHVYPDGAAPYFTVLAPGHSTDRLGQWSEIKSAVTEAIEDGGGTVTHHHAVGRDHRPGYDRQRPDLFAAQLRAAKRVVDPSALLNPGVLIDP
ncbi:MAG: FAD-binding oxidoreductase [Acidimicrobiales bacterium]